MSESEVVHLLEQKTTESLNLKNVAQAVKAADGSTWVPVVSLPHDPGQDAKISVEFVDMEMKALAYISRPGAHGADLTAYNIRNYLEVNGVLEGFLDEVIEGLENDPQYGEGVVVAEGKPPKNGENGKVVYTFETTNKIRLKEIDGGRMDFKELNNINNVVEGQVLAKLLPPERGEPGRTVTGKYLPAKDGKDVELQIGQNVKLSDDKRQALALVNGQVLVSGTKISVEPLYVVDGDVGLKTGNILFLGSVEVRGNVEDGFNVKAAGNIEIHGTVGRSILDAEGDIIVHNGITGRNEGSISSGGNIWAKFIENANAVAGGIVVVNEGIVNSTITCDHKIICRGKRANVVGGRLTAAEEIDAKTLGSIAGAETILEVGYDPKTKAQLDTIEQKMKALEKEAADTDLNLAGLEKLIKAKKEVSPEKKMYFENLQKRLVQIKTELFELKEDAARHNKYLEELKNNGRVSASDKVFPGVKIYIKDAYLEVRNDFKRVTFVIENNIVKITKYEESDQDIAIPQAAGKK